GFIPETELEQNTEYRVTLNLGRITDAPKELQEFRFSFKTIKQDFYVTTRDLQSYSKDWQYLNVVLSSSDEMDFETARQLIQATQGNTNLSVKLDKHMSTPKEFHLLIDSIKRFVEDSEVHLNWDGKPFQID